MKFKNLSKLAIMAIVLISCNQKKENTAGESLKTDLKYLMVEPKHYVCYHTDEAITIDGNLDKKAWQQAEWTDLFVDIEGDKKPLPKQNTKVKMLWDSTYLYIAAQLDEEHIWAYLENHDDVVYYDNDFEIFIDPDNDANNYFEFEINAKQTVFDLFMPHPYRHSSFALHNWDFKGLKKAVKIDGTLNNGNDKDKKWTVELAIPFTSLSFGLDSGKPDTEKLWRINFSRVEWDTKWENGKYVKITDKAGKALPEHNWVWSPVGVISMHMPERYGYLKFSTLKAGTAKEEFKLPETEKLKRMLWAVFYREEAYFEKNKKYSAQLAELGNDILSLFDQNNYKLSIIVAETQYEAKLESKDAKTRLYITNEGLIKDLSKK
ncbi:MAG: carbohydrate-binding family 9-like protein [Bacteroidetes bacterium]|nr:carbohydrate-binding family 9-like protein [Bacteroidota bacterium]